MAVFNISPTLTQALKYISQDQVLSLQVTFSTAKQHNALITLLEQGLRYSTNEEWNSAVSLLLYTSDVELTLDILRSGITLQELRDSVMNKTYSRDAIKVAAQLAPPLDMKKLPERMLISKKDPNAVSIRDRLKNFSLNSSPL